ncbi:VWFA and cache domain-containing protein 1-like [Mytilus galloprovincialis]|uniref:VWFA and cache domain-containing protein 1-like n=1 Tax=Mytilus galloprovincialis TaxID=29158 RepID=UPI003F7CD034
MKFLVLMTFFHTAIGEDEILNGQQLSNRLKEIKRGVGVDHMQEVYNNITFNPKTDDGNILLQKIRSSISSSLSELKKSLDIVAEKVLDKENSFSKTSSLPPCCRSSPSYQYDPKFRKEVDFNTACVIKSSLADNEALFPPADIGVTMKNKYENNKNILWQHYSTTEGTSIIYPATNWTRCSDFDPRWRPEFSATASPKPKDIVILIASTLSMKDPSSVPNKHKLVVAKEAAHAVINTLNPNDRVTAISFNSDVRREPGCYSDMLAFATKQNMKTVKEFVSLIPDSNINDQNFEKALTVAFSYFKSSSNDSVSERDQIILFVTAGEKTQGRDPVEVIRDENMKLQNRVVVFTYLLGPGSKDNPKKQLREMAEQIQSNTSYGSVRKGQYKNLDNLQTLAIHMSTFYLHLRKPSVDPIYTVPYVDPFSGIGLMTSMCRQVSITQGFNGVACTDVKVSELLKDVEYFEEGNSSYAFMIDKTGRTIVHPLLPDPTYLQTDPVLVDITTLERSPGSENIMSSIKSGLSGNKTLLTYFTIPRGNLINDGTSFRIVNATFYWSPVENTDFSICIVLGNEIHSKISESNFPISSEDLKNCFMYHNRSLSVDNFRDCRFNSRRVTLDRTSIKFTPSAFVYPFQYTDKEETAVDIGNYKRFFTSNSGDNPGFQESVRPDVWATYELDKFWKRTKSSHLAWRYVGTKSGVMRAYPGVSLEKTYDHKKRAWFRQTVAHPETMFVTPPYDDAWGSGILISLEHTIYKRNSKQVTAVVGTDFPLQYFSWFIEQVYPSCLSKYRCIIIEDSGFIVMHPTFKESTNKEKFLKFIHITVQEPALTKSLIKEGVLHKQECQDIAANKERRSFRVTMPTGHRGGLGFTETNNDFEIRPIPETNIFIIRQTETANTDCSCDKQIVPNARECGQCDCLCYNTISYQFCLNVYNVLSSFPCSASIPDTSGKSEPDDLTRLNTCFNPKCHEKQDITKCFSEAECGWCEFTDEGSELDPKCCRLKEDCSFGKTKSTNRDTCKAPVSPGANNNPSNSPSSNDTTSLVGGLAALAAILVTLIGIGTVYCIRRNKLCDGQYKDNDPYIDACHVDDGTGSGVFENDGMSCSSSNDSSNYTRTNPCQHQVPENNYTDTTFNHVG